MFCPRAGPSLQAQEPRLQFCRKHVFHRKHKNQGYSFTRDWIGAVASRYFPHATLSLPSEQTSKDLKRSHRHHVEVRRVDLANWALQTSPKFTTGVKYQFHKGFWRDQRSGNPNHPSPPPIYRRLEIGLLRSYHLEGVDKKGFKYPSSGFVSRGTKEKFVIIYKQNWTKIHILILLKTYKNL